MPDLSMGIAYSNMFDRAVRGALGHCYNERLRSLVKDGLVAYPPRLPPQDRVPRFASILGITFSKASAMLDAVDQIPLDFLVAPNSATVLSERLLMHRPRWPDVPLVTDREFCVGCLQRLPAQATFPDEWTNEDKRKGFVRVASLALKDRDVTGYCYPVVCASCELAHYFDRAVRRATSPQQQCHSFSVAELYIFNDFRELEFFRAPGRDGQYFATENLDLAVNGLVDMYGTVTGVEKMLEATRQHRVIGEVQQPAQPGSASFDRRKLAQALQAYLVCIWYDKFNASSPSRLRAGTARCSGTTSTARTSLAFRRCSGSAST